MHTSPENLSTIGEAVVIGNSQPVIAAKEFVKLKRAKPPRERTFFLHIPKTGGTAITQQLALFFEEQRVKPWGARLSDLANTFTGKTIDLPRTRIWEQQSPIDYDFYGREHTTLSAWQTLEEKFPELSKSVQFTVVRDPVRRSLSMLQHVRRVKDVTIQNAHLAGAMSLQERDNKLAFAHMARDLPLKQLLKQGQVRFQDMIDELFCNRATKTYSTEPVSATGKQHLASAMSNIEKMNLVGVQEDLDGTMRRVSALLDMPMPPQVLSANVGNYQQTIDSEMQLLFSELNELDVELCRFASSIHESAMRSLPSPDAYNEAWACRQPLEETSNGFEVVMDGPIPGWGWHCREGGSGSVPYLCWTTASAVLYLPFFQSASYELAIHCHATMDERNWSGTKVKIENRILDLMVTQTIDGMPVMTTTIGGLEGGDRWRKVEILPAITVSHHDLNPECDDARPKGLSVERVRLTRVLP